MRRTDLVFMAALLGGALFANGLCAQSAIISDPYLGIPSIQAAPAQVGYTPRFIRSKVRYVGNVFHPDIKDSILVTKRLTPEDTEIVWDQAPLLTPGDELELVDNAFYDLRAAGTFVKVRRASDRLEGFVPLETFFGETIPVDAPPVPGDGPLTVPIGSGTLMMPFMVNPTTAMQVVSILGGKPLRDTLTAPVSEGNVHPVTAANNAMVLLTSLMLLKPDDPAQAAGLALAKRIFDEYAFPEAIEVKPGAVAWPNRYDLVIPWYQTLKSPWFSGYSNGVMASAAAAMYRATGEARYAELARKGIAWMALPIEQGGALYRDGAFSFVAEYPMQSPLPQLRVLDGEMIAVLSIYNTAVLLGDADMLRLAARLAYSLANHLDLFITKDSRIQNARYQWLIDNDAYLIPMKRWAVQLGMLTKDQRFFDAGVNWRQSDVYWPK